MKALQDSRDLDEWANQIARDERRIIEKEKKWERTVERETKRRQKLDDEIHKGKMQTEKALAKFENVGLDWEDED